MPQNNFCHNWGAEIYPTAQRSRGYQQHWWWVQLRRLMELSISRGNNDGAQTDDKGLYEDGATMKLFRSEEVWDAERGDT